MRTCTYTLILLLSLLLLPTIALAWPGTVASVHDGDTITVKREDGTSERIRLYGVDCPELAYSGRWKTQHYAKVATRFVKELFRKASSVDVAIWEMGESYGRIVGGVIMLDNGETVQAKLVDAGLAWVDPRYCKKSMPECRTWTKMQEEAKAARRGLWRDAQAVPPWKWRRGGKGK